MISRFIRDAEGSKNQPLICFDWWVSHERLVFTSPYRGEKAMRLAVELDGTGGGALEGRFKKLSKFVQNLKSVKSVKRVGDTNK